MTKIKRILYVINGLVMTQSVHFKYKFWLSKEGESPSPYLTCQRGWLNDILDA